MACVRTAPLAAALLALLAAPAAASGLVDAGAAARRVVQQPDFQSRWPGTPPGSDGSASSTGRPSENPDPWRHASGSRDEIEPGNSTSLHLDDSGAASVARIVGWLLILGTCAVVIASLIGQRTARRDESLPAAPAPVPAPAAADGPLDDPEALAAAERWGEALHALLLSTLVTLATRRTGGLPSALTAREAARALALPPPSSGALGELLRAVESDLWGGRPAGREDWLRGRDAARALRATDAAA